MQRALGKSLETQRINKLLSDKIADFNDYFMKMVAFDKRITRKLVDEYFKDKRFDDFFGYFDLFVEEKLEALAGLRPRLITDVEKLPGARILDGQFTAVQQAMGTKPDREAAAAYMREFVEETKASGFVQGLIEKHGVVGRLSVAPPV